MVELIGDPCIPSQLVIPQRTTNQPTVSGSLFLSGAKLYIIPNTGVPELITSAA